MSEAQKNAVSKLPSEDDVFIYLMPQNPHCLFAYWDVPENFRLRFIKHLGNYFWEQSFPALKVINVSNNSSFTININDVATSLYIDIPFGESTYMVELGRIIPGGYFISIASSNLVAMPGSSLKLLTDIYFCDFNDLRDGNVDYKTLPKYDIHIPFIQSNSEFGLSSAEIYAFGSRENFARKG